MNLSPLLSDVKPAFPLSDCACEQCLGKRKDDSVKPYKAVYNNQSSRDVGLLFRKRVAPNEKSYRWSIGYSKACGYYSPGFAVPRFSGSSLNRKYSKELNESEAENIRREANSLAELASEKTKNSVQDESDRAAAGEYSRFIMEARISNIIERENIESARKSKCGIRCEVCKLLLRLCVCDTEVSANRVHVLSPRSRSKIRDKATAFYRACPHRRSFVTLTFISKISDSAAISILNKFLTQLKKKFKDFQYLWVAERQNKNQKFPGNIHFHLIVNRRLSVAVYNPLWVLQQYNSGLVAQNKYGREIQINEIRKRYKERTVGEVLNPFDIKKVVSINNLSAYLTKYLVKQDSKESFACAPWHCSRGVSRLFVRSVCSPSVFNALKRQGNWLVDKETGEIFEPIINRGAFWMCIAVNNKELVIPLLEEMEKVNRMQMDGADFYSNWRMVQSIDDDEYRAFYISEN